ncbi:protein translocase subunit SecF [Phycicoccus sp. CSK15P-2]|uniref:protein translocase subunit SecF n=1 Tax=Phycicoccus sp. CSK15P-2 TaxID=2807627 RepID=UPI00194FC915|nr:protein translocase subunit SecF [Phycicoccus sp. CSK15P-2]MBM6403907.1 protein translocase subunit SecF [Phycicoccus sp. CSK15P-2]
MSFSFAQLGNDLYSGTRSVPVVARRRRFYLGSVAVIVVALLGLGIQQLNLGLEFKGGSEFRVSGTTDTEGYESRARDAATLESGADVNVTLVGADTIRVQTSRLSDADSADVRASLAQEFGVPTEDVSATFVGPSWGATVSQKALQALVIFLVLVSLVMALYFRTWKMSLAALVALGHDLVITAGIYAWTGFEVSPATMIGFLTVLGYSLYDTVVVFDKVRENTTEAFANGRRSYAQAANLAVNQTMVRSINTTVVALLPITAVLVVGVLLLGPGTLTDLSVVLFIGLLAGAYSSIFIATPLLVSLRSKEARVVDLAKKAQAYQNRAIKRERDAARELEAGEPVGAAAVSGPRDEAGPREEGATLTGRAVHQYARSGPRNQPKRTPKSKR